MSAVDAYAAGIFDADGCIGIYEAMKHDNRRRYMRIQVMVANNDGTLMRFLKDHFGGSINYRTAKCMQWRQDSREKVRIFLEAIRPYTIVKTAQIDVGLEFLSITKHSRDADDRALRVELRERIALLKKEVVPYESGDK